MENDDGEGRWGEGGGMAVECRVGSGVTVKVRYG